MRDKVVDLQSNLFAGPESLLVKGFMVSQNAALAGFEIIDQV